MQRNDRRTRRTELRSCRHLVGFVTLLYKDLFKPALCKGGGSRPPVYSDSFP